MDFHLSIKISNRKFTDALWWKLLNHQGEILVTGLHRQLTYWMNEDYETCIQLTSTLSTQALKACLFTRQKEKSSLTRLAAVCFKKIIRVWEYHTFWKKEKDLKWNNNVMKYWNNMVFWYFSPLKIQTPCLSETTHPNLNVARWKSKNPVHSKFAPALDSHTLRFCPPPKPCTQILPPCGVSMMYILWWWIFKFNRSILYQEKPDKGSNSQGRRQVRTQGSAFYINSDTWEFGFPVMKNFIPASMH